MQVEANVGAPQVNYRESISKISEVKYVHKKQSGGQGQFADITVRFEPMDPGSGYEFKSEIKGGAVPKEYIPGVMKGLEECMSNASLMNCKITSLPFTYLGIPIRANPRREETWKPIVDKVQKGWHLESIGHYLLWVGHA